MPYDKDTIMWQLSFPLSETKAKELSKKGAEAMKDEAYEVNLIKNDKTVFPGLVKNIHSTRGHKYIKIISIIDLSNLKENL